MPCRTVRRRPASVVGDVLPAVVVGDGLRARPSTDRCWVGCPRPTDECRPIWRFHLGTRCDKPQWGGVLRLTGDEWPGYPGAVTRLRTRAVHVALLTGLFAWFVGSFAAVLHNVVVQHVVCAEHGELVELDALDNTVASAHASGPEIRSAAPDAAHGHDCMFDLVVFDGMTISDPSELVLPLVWSSTSLLAIAEAPRGPPLAYAPKTSPPFVS